MARYLLRRVLLIPPTLLVVATLVFVIFRLVPGDPAQLVAGDSASADVVQSIRHQLGLDRPLIVQYGRYLAELARGNLGTSPVYGDRVASQVLGRLPASVLLACAAMIIASVVGVTAGVIAATHRSSWVDYVCTLGAVGGISFPGFWLGLMLIIVFAVTFRWFPVAGLHGPRSLVLPAVTLAVNQMAVIARMTRSSMVQVLDQDYIRTARAKGLHERLVLLRHALGNALIPTVTIAGLQFGYLLGGSVIIETVFAWPGVGRLLIDAIQTRDYATVQAVVLLFAILALFVNLVVDLLYAALDPRVRYA
ncbi:MAG: ABC transporter permease [Chloroflexota bacterium]|nr:ABC transporter permease [Chloroflexota bacterium]